MLIIKLIIFFALLFGITGAQGQQFLKQDYNFIGRGLGTTKLRQSHDTLYLFRDYSAVQFGASRASLQNFQKTGGEHFKIFASSRQGPYDILKVEQLDTVKLTAVPYPETRYLLIILNRQSSSAIGFLKRRIGSTKAQLDTTRVSIESLRKNFYFTYFSETYMKKLAELRRVSTKEQAQEITEEIKGAESKVLIEKYQSTQPQDYYASALVSELINLACIRKRYSPIGAQTAINQLLK